MSQPAQVKLDWQVERVASSCSWLLERRLSSSPYFLHKGNDAMKPREHDCYCRSLPPVVSYVTQDEISREDGFFWSILKVPNVRAKDAEFIERSPCSQPAPWSKQAAPWTLTGTVNDTDRVVSTYAFFRMSSARGIVFGVDL